MVWETVDLSKLRAFGSIAHYLIPKEKRRKFDNSSLIGVMVRYAFEGYSILDIEENTVFPSRNIVFDENHFYIDLVEWANMPSSYNPYKPQTENLFNDFLQNSANNDND